MNDRASLGAVRLGEATAEQVWAFAGQVPRWRASAGKDRP
jgi:hypothetical protein